MANNTATLALNGVVLLEDFSKAVSHLWGIMNGLSDSIAKDAKIQWQVESLEVSSAIITVVGVTSARSSKVPQVVRAYEKLAKSIAKPRQRISGFSPTVTKHAKNLGEMPNGRISSIRFETRDMDVELHSGQNHGVATEEVADVSLGAVEGRIQSMTNRGSLRFILYDNRDDHAISCYLLPGSEDAMRSAWGKVATVEGLVRRNRQSGKVTTVREISHGGISVHDGGGNWRDAVGCAPAIPGSISAEEAVRRGRDG